MKMPLGMRNKMLGQGMTEYIIIVALVAVAAIGTFKLFGQTMRTQMAGLATELGGKNADAVITSAQGSAAESLKRAKADKDMGNYDDDNEADFTSK